MFLFKVSAHYVYYHLFYCSTQEQNCIVLGTVQTQKPVSAPKSPQHKYNTGSIPPTEHLDGLRCITVIQFPPWSSPGKSINASTLVAHHHMTLKTEI